MRLENLYHVMTSAMLLCMVLAKSVRSPLDPIYETCGPRNCGSGPNISYPFYVEGAGADFCGLQGLRITCRGEKPMFVTSRGPYVVEEIAYEKSSIRLVDLDVIDASKCPAPKHYFAFDQSPLEFSSSHANLEFFYGCNESFPLDSPKSLVVCASNSSHLSFVALAPTDDDFRRNRRVSSQYCESEVSVPVDSEEYWPTIETFDYVELLRNGFTLVWRGDTCIDCEKTGGRCGFRGNATACFCPDGPPNSSLCNVLTAAHVAADNKKTKLKLGLGLGIPLGVLIFLMIGFFIRRYYIRRRKAFLSRNISDQNMNTDTEAGFAHYGIPLFSYKDLEEATNNFNSEKELGDGGFGTVYHGVLKDGRQVAVKRLYEHNYKRVEQFVNEIEILTRLRHQNLVTLYGCTSHRSRELLLVYEYIPNGTVADHLHGDRAATSPLTWPVRMSVAVETATALAYLHASDTVHRDVKTNNILLDDNFCVKVADFGLSRLFPNDVTHVSTAPQGTPGYVDPEYHQCYQLTSKSDVYSFGVVLVELVSSMPAVDITRHRHEINLSNLATSKIKKRAYDELVDPRLGFDSDPEAKRMIIAVAELAFKCLQQDKEMRPTMEEVLEELKRIQSRDNVAENRGSFDGVTTLPPPSLDRDEAHLLNNTKEEPLSPNTVTKNWPSNRSITPDISA